MAGKTITFNRYVDGDIGDKPISRLKHNNVTYEIADEQARTDLINKADKTYVDNKTVVDSTLSDSSENPVQNKVVKSAIDNIYVLQIIEW